MSTTMYCYRIEKAKFWLFCDAVRKWYLEPKNQRFFLRTVAELTSMTWADASTDLEKIRHNRENHIHLQLFDEGTTWVIRVLGAGYQFMNNREQFENIEDVFYDNRPGMPDKGYDNEAIMNWLDDQIKARHYFMVTIIDEQTILDLYFKWRLENRKNQNDSKS